MLFVVLNFHLKRSNFGPVDRMPKVDLHEIPDENKSPYATMT
jgi:hypothetical protein